MAKRRRRYEGVRRGRCDSCLRRRQLALWWTIDDDAHLVTAEFCYSCYVEKRPKGLAGTYHEVTTMTLKEGSTP